MDENSSVDEAALKAFEEAEARATRMAKYMAEVRKNVHDFHRKRNRQKRWRSLRTWAISLLGGGVLACGTAIGVNYGLSEYSYVRDNGTRVENHAVGLVDHISLEIRTDESRAITHYTPFGSTTSRAYIDSDGDGQVDQVWRSLEHNGSPLEFRGSSYSRGDAVFNENYDGIFQEGLESFGEPIIVESR